MTQPFTSDRDLLLSLVGELHKKVQRAGTVKSQCPELTDLQAQHIRNNLPDEMPLRVAIAETIICQNLEQLPNPEMVAEPVVRSAAAQQFEENQHRYRGLLTSLRQYLRSLRHFEGKKSLILISDGFLSDYVRYELQDVTDMALRSGVIFNTVDVRGLYTTNYQASDRVVAGNNKNRLCCFRGNRRCGPMISATRRTRCVSFPERLAGCTLGTPMISQPACERLSTASRSTTSCPTRLQTPNQTAGTTRSSLK